MNGLIQIAETRLGKAKDELERAFSKSMLRGPCVVTDDEDRHDWWSWQISDAARKHGYFADLSRPHRWVLLGLSLPEIENPERDSFCRSTPSEGRPIFMRQRCS